MNHTLRRLLRWSLAVVTVLLVATALYVTTLAYPTPLFAHEARIDDYRIYSDEPIPPWMEQVIDESERRVSAMEHESNRTAPRIYLCNSRKRYAFFARLARMNPDTLALGLSVANEMFVSTSRVRDFADANRQGLRHTRFEGDLSEVIAHEIAHFNSVDAIGYRAHLAQPMWKSEGWAEYQANLATIREDPDYDLGERIEVLLDDGLWGGSGLARDLWESQLLVEFLGEVKGHRLADLIRHDVTRAGTRAEMLDWYRERP